jgi:hypothetical protein
MSGTQMSDVGRNLVAEEGAVLGMFDGVDEGLPVGALDGVAEGVLLGT